MNTDAKRMSRAERDRLRARWQHVDGEAARAIIGALDEVDGMEGERDAAVKIAARDRATLDEVRDAVNRKPKA